jgi:type II secretory pathway pseudopilin PulG
MVSLERWKIVVIGIAIALAGAVAGYLPSLVKDVLFLHDARIFAELQQRQQQAQQATQPTSHQVTQDNVQPTPSPPKK